MDVKFLMNLSLQVLKDKQVIMIAVVCIFFMMLGSYIVKYRKKPRVIKAKAKPAPAPKPEPKPEENSGDGEGE